MRTTRRRTLPALLIAAIVAASGSAAAKPKPIRDELPADAQRAWDDAVLVVTSRNPEFSRALVKFQEAYNASKNPRVLFNIAVCEQKLNHFARASARLKQELAEGGTKLDPQETKEINTLLAALDRFLTTVDVTVNEADATVTINGDLAGTTPLPGPVTVDSGPVDVVVDKKDFETATQHLTTSSGVPAKVQIVLEPKNKTSLVEVNVSGPADATILIDGIDRGKAPFKGVVPVGNHDFTARSPGYATTTSRLEVVFKQPLTVSLPMALERHEGRVHFETVPDDASIEIDGRVVGKGVWEGVLPSQPHQVVVKKPGYLPYQSELTVTDDANLTRRATLTEERSGSWIPWVVGGIVVIGGGAIASYLLFKPQDQQPVIGTLDPGTLPARFRF